MQTYTNTSSLKSVSLLLVRYYYYYSSYYYYILQGYIDHPPSLPPLRPPPFIFCHFSYSSSFSAISRKSLHIENWSVIQFDCLIKIYSIPDLISFAIDGVAASCTKRRLFISGFFVLFCFVDLTGYVIFDRYQLLGGRRLCMRPLNCQLKKRKKETHFHPRLSILSAICVTRLTTV